MRIIDLPTKNLNLTLTHPHASFAQTINLLKGKVTILFITHQLPKGLHVDEAIVLGKESMQMQSNNAKNANPNEEQTEG